MRSVCLGAMFLYCLWVVSVMDKFLLRISVGHLCDDVSLRSGTLWEVSVRDHCMRTMWQ